MNHTRISLRLSQAALSMAIMYVAIQLAVHFGVEKKPWWQVSWEFLVGGSLGVIAGVSFFLTFGAIGFVSGALFGAIGLVGLALGGALGGLGLGAIVHIVRDPGRYNFNWLVIAPLLVVGSLFAWVATSMLGARFGGSPTSGGGNGR